ncbi:hypothetical protein [Eoetvoesiella caeni]
MKIEMIIRQMLEMSNGKVRCQTYASSRRGAVAFCADVAAPTLENNLEIGPRTPRAGLNAFLRAGASAGANLGAPLQGKTSAGFRDGFCNGFFNRFFSTFCGNKKAACFANKRLSVFGCGGRI